MFKSKNVTDIVRLNSPEYDEDEFISAGFKFHDLFFTGLVLIFVAISVMGSSTAVLPLCYYPDHSIFQTALHLLKASSTNF